MRDSYYLEKVPMLSVVWEHPNTFVQFVQYQISSCSSKSNCSGIKMSSTVQMFGDLYPLWVPSPNIPALEAEESSGTYQARKSVPILPVVPWLRHTGSLRSTRLCRGPDTRWEFSLTTVETACVSLGRTPGKWRQCGLENIEVGNTCWSKGHFCSHSLQHNFT